jgi:hypothetical protein
VVIRARRSAGIDQVVARLDAAHSVEGTIMPVGTGFRFLRVVVWHLDR